MPRPSSCALTLGGALADWPSTRLSDGALRVVGVGHHLVQLGLRQDDEDMQRDEFRGRGLAGAQAVAFADANAPEQLGPFGELHILVLDVHVVHRVRAAQRVRLQDGRLADLGLGAQDLHAAARAAGYRKVCGSDVRTGRPEPHAGSAVAVGR